MQQSCETPRGARATAGLKNWLTVLTLATIAVLGLPWVLDNGAEEAPLSMDRRARLLRQIKADTRTVLSAVRFIVDFDHPLRPLPVEEPTTKGPVGLAMPTNTASGVPTV